MEMIREERWGRPDGRGERTVRIGRCDCGGEVALANFTNTCAGCGADYSTTGQRLAARSQWGEETGEHAADVARITGWEDDLL